MQQRTPSPPTARVIAVMELLIRSGEAFTASRVASTLGLSRATTSAILGELTGAGWARRVANGYLVGPGFPGRAADGVPVPAAVQDELRELTDRARCGATLSRADAGTLTVVARQQGGEQAVPAIAIGQQLPLAFPGGASVLPWREVSERRAWLSAVRSRDRPVATGLLGLVEERGVALFRPSVDDTDLVDVLTHLLQAAGPDLLNPRLREQAVRQLERLSAHPYTAEEIDGDEPRPLSYLAAPVRDATGTATHELQLGPLRADVGRTERRQYIDHIRRTADALDDLL